MPALATVTDDEIETAGRGLAAAGRAVNGWSLRRVIGRGDPNRLNAIWEERQRAAPQPASVAAELTRPLPPVVAERVTAFQERLGGHVSDMANGLWHAAERIAFERFHGEAEAARAELAAVRAQLDEAGAVVSAADQARADAVARADEMEDRLVAASEELDAARARAVASEAVASAARADLRAALGNARGVAAD